MSSSRVLIIGGYGVFGGLLAQRLAQEPGIDLIIAGRSREKALAHCRAHGGRALELDLRGDLANDLRTIEPDIVIDAAGPFQAYGDHEGGDRYRVARAAISAGAHYLDLADDAHFVAGISCLDAEARAANVTILSGCSSVPAISAAAADHLAQSFAEIESVEANILPGNRAPRGLSVIQAILAQAGRPLDVWEAGQWRQRAAWVDVEARTPGIAGRRSLGRRYASLIGVPDLLIFPERYRARTARFLAGLELPIMHRGLAWLATLVRRGWVTTLVPLARPLQWIANLLKPFGSDRGAMTVTVTGYKADGAAELRRWTLVAEAGDGPKIPPTPAYVCARKLMSTGLAPGARPCVGEVTLPEIEEALARYAIATAETGEARVPLFARALGDHFATLPVPIQRLHTILDRDTFEGRASVECGTGLLARALAWLIGFPAATNETSVRVDMIRDGDAEIWRRTFADRTFSSELKRDPGAPAGEISERFGPFHFRIPLKVAPDGLAFPVSAGWLFGLIPLPAALLPRSDAVEAVDSEGRATFDVALSHPWAGLIVRYRGWLVPADAHATREQEGGASNGPASTI